MQGGVNAALTFDRPVRLRHACHCTIVIQDEHRSPFDDDGDEQHLGLQRVKPESPTGK